MRPLLFALCVTCASATVVAPTVRVAHAEDAATKTAKKYYERGQKLFNLRKFDEALEQFQKAFDTKPIPGILFNIGQTHRNLGDKEAAIFSFKRYLQLKPEAENRDQVEDLIAELQDEVDRERAAQEEPDQPPPDLRVKEDPNPRPPPLVETPPEGRPAYKKWWFWTGVALVGVAGGIGIWAATRSQAEPPMTDLGTLGPP